MLCHRFRRLTPCAAVLSAVLAALPAGSAYAAAPTPHLDAVQRGLRGVSPGLDGQVWARSGGNGLDAGGWLLQTPGCWGDPKCANRVGTRRLLAKMTENISQARRTVDISSLAPLPNGAFQDAIVAGLKAAVADGRKLRVRVLVGAAPVYNLNVIPALYGHELVNRLGKAAENITLNVASMTTSKASFSWNHTKLVVVDGESVITGGINDWKDDYIDTTHPVSDVDLALRGPAARAAGTFLDTLWTWTCRNSGDPNSVWLATSNSAACMPTLEKDANPEPVKARGDIPVIAVGGLGVGIRKSDPASSYRPTLPTASDTRCGIGVHDNTNADRDYETVNPEESALRSLIGSAHRRVEISQQDLNGTCPPLPRYDIRLYDTLAAKLAEGVKVRIVVSDPANRGLVGSGGYSQIRSLSEISDTLRERLARVTGDQRTAHAKMCANLQLASFRSAPTDNWADGHPYALHHKVVSVDDSAFYLGSKNLYPSWLQDFGYIVESPAAARQLQTRLLDPEWTYSRGTATVDYARGLCPR
ncbi:phospholipase D-like domain-containing protein [Streptantibioticus rubrisoli]|uniref:Phospholipase D-like domain-containing protein n=1 Tax=Streptantibioticus rubrisoli TaxID=1387313 RepID=A0ABT1P9A0_9ACTN|nr:phospholipase D-like domain-containing protein [Streptantibioticus rubrisoli]MCQ4040828.1 phospholipase D-like domain-containing protein [Streptantibioticus rubrisoli]